jgi:sigma-54-specific transcriptional regulator
VQVKLLRVLQEREVVRLGSRQAQPIDVRLIAATNVDLSEAVAANRFREDLFYRLNVAAIALAPLRDRPGDILPLACYFLDLYRQRLGLSDVALSADAGQALLDHAWPGNIRELDNVIHRALLVFQGKEISVQDLRLTSRERPSTRSAAPPKSAEQALTDALLALFEQGEADLYLRVEGALMRTAYRFCERNQVQTAKLLGISRNIVRARLAAHGEITVRPRGSSLATYEEARSEQSRH